MSTAARRHTVIQLTDPHIGPDGGTERDPLDTAEPLRRALRAVRSSGLAPTAVVFTGDLAEHGDPAEYRRLKSIVDSELPDGVPVRYLPGNHDDRAAMREHLLGVPAADTPLDAVTELAGLRLITLDSTVPDRGYGDLRPEQLDWLRTQLRTPAEDGTVLALHHPPLPSLGEFTDAIRLRDPGALADAIRGSDVRVVLAGHIHVVAAGVLAGVPVWTGGAISTTLDGLGTLERGLRGLANAGVSRIELLGPADGGGVLCLHVPTDAEQLTEIPAPALAGAIAQMRAEFGT